MKRVELFKPFKKQQTFIDAAMSGMYKYLTYGGAIRGGKTFVTLAILIMLAKMYPGSRWAIVRKDLPTIKRNLLPSWHKIAPSNFCRPINLNTMTVQCQNGSEIIFFPETATSDPELNRWRGLEVNGFDLEEANELQEASFYKAVERAGSWLVDPMPPILVMLTCNPSEGYVKKLFHDPFTKGQLKAPYFYLPATIFDNPYIPEEYKQSLKNLPKEIYQRFVLGNWSISEDPLQIIPYLSLYSRLADPEVIAEMIRDQKEPTVSMGIDVAEYGNDLTTFVYMSDAIMSDLEDFSKKRTDEISSLAMMRIVDRRIPHDNVGVDAIGVGAGVWGDMTGAGYKVRRIIAGEAPIEGVTRFATSDFKFRNLKAQMWWALREDVLDSESGLTILNNQRLVDDLTAVRYRIAGEKVLEVESKDQLRKRIGRSPDSGDAAVIANWVRTYRVAKGAMVTTDEEMAGQEESARDRFHRDRQEEGIGAGYERPAYMRRSGY